jgi:hypothetical protein
MNCRALRRTNLTKLRREIRLVVRLTSCVVAACFLTTPSGVGQSTSAVLQSGVSRYSAEPQSMISLAPSPKPSAQMVARHSTDSRFDKAPANYHVFPAATVGEFAGAEVLTLNFAGETRLTGIKSTNKDFVIEPGGTCLEGVSYSRGGSCSVLVRFSPQGPGHRLGFLSIANSAEATPANVGLLGNGYVPVISFTPALITTVPVTVSSGTGVIKNSTNLTIAGDVLYIADPGNILIREVDSSGTLTNVAPDFTTPVSVAVDSFGIIWAMSAVGSTYYFSIYEPWGQSAWGTAYKSGTCTVSTPCAFTSVGMDDPADIGIDANNNLFFEERTKGAAEMPVGNVSNGGALDLWYLSDTYAYDSGSAASFGVDPSDNLYTVYDYGAACFILGEPLYGAENGDATFTRVAGASKCGYSGDGGLATDAEISSSVGQIAFDIAGNLYFADSGNQRVRRIDAATGIIRTIAGNGTAGYKGDGGTATTAELDAPTGVGIDSQGQVYILSNAPAAGPTQVVRKVGTTGDLVFPSTTQSVASATLIVNVANTGNNTLTFLRDTITGANPGDFSIDLNTTSCNFAAGNNLYGGQDCQIGVIFKPAAVGARTATINLVDNTVNGVNKINLSGTAVAPAKVEFTAPAATADIAPATKITVSVKVTSSYSTPTGKVTFSIDGKVVGSSNLVSGEASLGVGSLASGTHHLLAAYSGDKYHAPAKTNESLTVQ